MEEIEKLHEIINIYATFSFDPKTIKRMLLEDAEFREAEILKEWKLRAK